MRRMEADVVLRIATETMCFCAVVALSGCLSVNLRIFFFFFYAMSQLELPGKVSGARGEQSRAKGCCSRKGVNAEGSEQRQCRFVG